MPRPPKPPEISDQGLIAPPKGYPDNPALMARREHGLLPVILHLRRIEGSGTYRASQTIWPEEHRIEHAAAALFGIWVKGQALMNETISRSCPAGVEGVIEAALPLISKP